MSVFSWYKIMVMSMIHPLYGALPRTPVILLALKRVTPKSALRKFQARTAGSEGKEIVMSERSEFNNLTEGPPDEPPGNFFGAFFLGHVLLRKEGAWGVG